MQNPEEIFKTYFDNIIKLDIRDKDPGYYRFMDQKVTLDVLWFIAGSIVHFNAPKFSVKDIWHCSYFLANSNYIFGKPPPTEETAYHEYDKFVGQPLKALAYARVLKEIKISGTNYYIIKHNDILELISSGPDRALKFIRTYVTKVLTDSHFYHNIDNFFEENTPEGFLNLKTQFIHFMRASTKIRNDQEIRRIFPKILNPLAHKKGKFGVRKGFISKTPITSSDLRYNRTNFRDINKVKSITRQQAKKKAICIPPISIESRINNLKQFLKNKYPNGEKQDSFWERDATYQAHHIFPTHSHPIYAAIPENIIILTLRQHMECAHPKGKTNQVDKYYQLECLIAKCDSIKESAETLEVTYDIPQFIKMLNECLDVNIPVSYPKDQVEAIEAIDQVKEKILELL